MKRLITGLTIIGVALVVMLLGGVHSNAQAGMAYTGAQANIINVSQMRVDRDLGVFHSGDANVYGDDLATNSITERPDADAMVRQRAYTFQPAPDSKGLSSKRKGCCG